MAGPIRPDEYRDLATLQGGPIKRDREGGDTRFQSLIARGMAEEKRGTCQLTMRGKVTLQRRTGMRRGLR